MNPVYKVGDVLRLNTLNASDRKVHCIITRVREGRSSRNGEGPIYDGKSTDDGGQRSWWHWVDGIHAKDWTKLGEGFDQDVIWADYCAAVMLGEVKGDAR